MEYAKAKSDSPVRSSNIDMVGANNEAISEVLERAMGYVKEHTNEAMRHQELAKEHFRVAEMWAQVLSGTSAELGDLPDIDR